MGAGQKPAQSHRRRKPSHEEWCEKCHQALPDLWDDKLTGRFYIFGFVGCFFFKCKPSYFKLFDCVLRRIWSPQWTGCRISTQCTHQSSWTSQNQWLSTRKNTSRRFLTSSKIQIKGKLLRRIKALINIKTVNLSFSNKIIIRSAKRENCHCVFQPSQQLHDHEGGEEDGIRLGSEVSGNRAALPGGHVWNQKGERRCSTDLFPDWEKGKIKQIGF